MAQTQIEKKNNNNLFVFEVVYNLVKTLKLFILNFIVKTYKFIYYQSGLILLKFRIILPKNKNY